VDQKIIKDKVKKGGPEDKNHAYFCGMDPRVIQILAICNF
jgi:hypothetical protein